MDRNTPLVPFYALVLGLAAALTAWLYQRHVGAQPALSTLQIALVAFGMLLAVYGVVGLLSVWLEGVELRPGRRLPARSRGAMLIGLILTVCLVVLAGAFVRQVRSELAGGVPHPAADGLLAGTSFLLTAALLVVYKKYFVHDDITTDSFGSEVPW